MLYPFLYIFRNLPTPPTIINQSPQPTSFHLTQKKEGKKGNPPTSVATLAAA